MFNYQNQLYVHLVRVWDQRNETLDNMQRSVCDLTQRTNMYIDSTSEKVRCGIGKLVEETPILQEMYSEWQNYYKETYQWIHPKLSELSNTSLHYGSGVSIGVLASVLILFYVLSRMLPSRLKTIAYILCLFGTSATMFMFSSIQKMLSDNVADMFLDYWQYLIAYIIVTGLLSFAVVYRYGPIEDRRTLSLIQWFLQAAGLVLVYNSSQIREVSIALVILLLTIYNFPKVAIKNQRFKNMWYKLFPPKIRLLSEDEYIRQGDTETRRELEKLREFCRSPECKTWKVISKLKDPHRFAEFIEGDSWHVTNAELLDYDSDPDPVPPHLLDEDNEEEEMDFQLGSP